MATLNLTSGQVLMNGRLVELLWTVTPAPAYGARGFPDWRPGFQAGSVVTLTNSSANTTCTLEHIQTWSTIYDWTVETGGSVPAGTPPGSGFGNIGLSSGTYFLQYVLVNANGLDTNGVPLGTPVGLTNIVFLTVTGSTPGSNITYGFPVQSAAGGLAIPAGWMMAVYVTQPGATSMPDPTQMFLYMTKDSTTYNTVAVYGNISSGYPTAPNPNYSTASTLAALYAARSWQPSLKWYTRWRIPEANMVTIGQSVSVSAPAGVLQDAYGNATGSASTGIFTSGGTESSFTNYSLVDSSGFSSDLILPPVDLTGKSTATNPAGQVYYISSSLGNNGNTTTQAQTYAGAWKSFDRAISGPGTTPASAFPNLYGQVGWIAVLFRRGDQWPGGQVNSVVVTNPGHSYTLPPTVTIATTRGFSVAATAHSVLGSGATAGQVVAVVIDNPGSGYVTSYKMTVTFTNAFNDTTGTGAAAVGFVNQGFNQLNNNGLDFAHPLIFGTYWNPADGPDPGTRPLLTLVNSQGAMTWDSGGQVYLSNKHIVVRGIEFSYTPVPGTQENGGPGGLGVFLRAGRNILAEDIKVTRCSGGMGGGVLYADPAETGMFGRFMTNVMYHRCLSLDSYSVPTHSQGLLTEFAVPWGNVASQTILDQDGYPNPDLLHCDYFSHGDHGNFGNAPNIYFESMVRRGGASGIQFRGGGCTAYCMLSRNSIQTSSATLAGTNSTFSVFEKSKDMPFDISQAAGAPTIASSAFGGTTWTQNSTTVVGNGTFNFTTLNPATTWIRPHGTTTWYQISSIASSTQLFLVNQYAGTTISSALVDENISPVSGATWNGVNWIIPATFTWTNGSATVTSDGTFDCRLFPLVNGLQAGLMVRPTLSPASGSWYGVASVSSDGHSFTLGYPPTELQTQVTPFFSGGLTYTGTIDIFLSQIATRGGTFDWSGFGTFAGASSNGEGVSIESSLILNYSSQNQQYATSGIKFSNDLNLPLATVLVRNNTFFACGSGLTFTQNIIPSTSPIPLSWKQTNNIIAASAAPGTGASTGGYIFIASPEPNWNWYASDYNVLSSGFAQTANCSFNNGSSGIALVTTWQTDVQSTSGISEAHSLLNTVPTFAWQTSLSSPADMGSYWKSIGGTDDGSGYEQSYINNLRGRPWRTWRTQDKMANVIKYYLQQYAPTNLPALGTGKWDYYGASDYRNPSAKYAIGWTGNQVFLVQVG